MTALTFAGVPEALDCREDVRTVAVSAADREKSTQ